MIGKTHQLIGFTAVYTGALLYPFGDLNTQTIIASIFLSSIGSLTPDLDNEKNKLYTFIPVLPELFANFGEKLFGKHRSISHSIIGLWILGYISHWLIYKIPVENGLLHEALWYSFFISVIAHVAADAFTKEGVPLLWPLKFKFGVPPFKFLRVKTGSRFELYFVRTVVFIFLGIITYTKWNVLVEIFK